MIATFRNEATTTRSQLIAGDFPVTTEARVIATGQQLTIGAVLGRVTASGEMVLSTAGANDGSEVPEAILSENVDTSEGAETHPVFLTGSFNERALIFGAGHTVESTRQGLREKNIFMNDTVA